MIELTDRDFGLPSDEAMSTEDGLVENHHYVDMRGIPRETWQAVLDSEEKLVEMQRLGLDPDDAIDDQILVDLDTYQLGLDLGIGSTVAALSIIGACPVTSCSGAHEGAYEKHPLVLAWVPADARAVLEAAAREVGVNLTGGYEPGVLVWVDAPAKLEKMREFALALVRLFDEKGTSR